MNNITIGTAELVAAFFIGTCLWGRLLTWKAERMSEVAYLGIFSSLFLMLLSRGIWNILPGTGSTAIRDAAWYVSVCSYFLFVSVYILYLRSELLEVRPVSRLWIVVAAVFGVIGAAFWVFFGYPQLILVGHSEIVRTSGYFYLGQCLSITIVVEAFIMIITYSSAFSRKRTVLFLGFILIPIAAHIISKMLGGPDIFDLGFAAMSFIIYQSEYVDSRNDYYQQKAKLAEAELTNIVQQVQPHFLYNVLNSIYHLCGKDPSAAQEAIGEFSECFRANLKAITTQEPISIVDEIENVKSYVYLEEMRFEDKLVVDYDIQSRDFSVPPLSIRPLVENAIKHGVGKIDHPLHVRISTVEFPDRFEVVVKDDGPGYQEGVFADNTRKHIGIDNLRRRIDMIGGGRLEIVGKSGEGTVAVITFAKE